MPGALRSAEDALPDVEGDAPMGLMDTPAIAPMFGPRNSVVRILNGEDVSIAEMVLDRSEFVDARFLYFHEMPELWVDNVHDHVGGP